MQPLTKPNLFAFVIMPFKPEFDEFYFQIILPTLSECGYRVERADSPLDQRNILKDIIHKIDVADLIIADITDANPNVMYELGVSHALDKPTIMLTQDIDAAPFDLASYNLNLYSIRFDKIGIIIDRLREIAKAHCNGNIEFGNPVSDFAPSRQQKDNSNLHSKNTTSNLDGIVLQPAISINKITKHTNNINDLINKFSEQLINLSAQLFRISEKPSITMQEDIVRLSKAKNANIHILVERANPELIQYRIAWQETIKAVDEILSIVNLNNDEDITALEKFRATLNTTEHNVAVSVEVMKHAKSKLGFPIVTEDDRKAQNLLAEFFDACVTEFTIGDSYLCRIMSIIDGLLQPSA